MKVAFKKLFSMRYEFFIFLYVLKYIFPHHKVHPILFNLIKSHVVKLQTINISKLIFKKLLIVEHEIKIIPNEITFTYQYFGIFFFVYILITYHVNRSQNNKFTFVSLLNRTIHTSQFILFILCFF